MQEDQRRAAKGQLIALMQAGHPWQEAAAIAGLPDRSISGLPIAAQCPPARRSRLAGWKAWASGQTSSNQCASGWRTTCREAPHTPSHMVQAALQEQFRYPGQHWTSQSGAGRTGRRQPHWFTGKKTAVPLLVRGTSLARRGRWTSPRSSRSGNRPAFHLGSEPCLRVQKRQTRALAHLSCASRRMLVLTLLFLGVVGLRRTWDLRGYTGDALALLSGRKRAYGYFHTERLLSQMAQANGAGNLDRCACSLDSSALAPASTRTLAQSATFYIDGHRKPVYTEALIPRGLVGRLSTFWDVEHSSCCMTSTVTLCSLRPTVGIPI